MDFCRKSQKKDPGTGQVPGYGRSLCKTAKEKPLTKGKSGGIMHIKMI
jgi:hypothetical protein